MSNNSVGGHRQSKSSDTVPESMRRLLKLKEKIQEELHEETVARKQEQHREPLIPLGLAAEYASPVTVPTITVPSPAARRAALHHSRARATQPPTSSAARTGPQEDTPQDPDDPINILATAREKIGSLKLDKNVQRELESELESRCAESTQLKAHNSRLKAIIALRQESDSRRHRGLQKEVLRLNTLCDDACVDRSNIDVTMEKLRSLNTAIQQGAAQLKTRIGEQADAERLQLIRNYRVKLREVKQMLQEQVQLNLEGARVWIDRHRVLESDRNTAANALQQLSVHNEHLEVQNKELEVMLKHQEEQRDSLISRIAVVKRENNRLREHLSLLESELHSLAQQPAEPARRPQTVSSRPSSRPHPVKGDDPILMRTDALNKLRRTLDHLRERLKTVRSAHVELLQERTELEVFMRQCMEDVRRDIYRFTVVSNAGKARGKDSTERVLENYSNMEKRQLLGVLQSKLRVFATLHASMFPGGSEEEADILQSSTSRDESPSVLPADDEGSLARALDPHSVAERRRADALLAGHTMFSPDKIRQDTGVEIAIDQLWNRWKTWTSVRH